MSTPIPINPPPERDYRGADKPKASQPRSFFAVGVVVLWAILLFDVFCLELHRCSCGSEQAATETVAEQGVA